MSYIKIYRSIEPVYINEETGMGSIPIKFYQYLIFANNNAKYLLNPKSRLDFEYYEFRDDITGVITELNDFSNTILFTNSKDGSEFQFHIEFTMNQKCCNVVKSKKNEVDISVGVFCLQADE